MTGTVTMLDILVTVACALLTAGAGLFLGWCIWGGDDRG